VYSLVVRAPSVSVLSVSNVRIFNGF